jgi:hypothetical protein
MAEGRHIQELMILYAGGVNGRVLLSGSAVEAKVAASRFPGRKSLSIFNFSATTMYWAWNESQANTLDGFPILSQTGQAWIVDDATALYLFGTGDARVQESK